MEAWVHVLTDLLKGLPQDIKISDELRGYAKQLDSDPLSERPRLRCSHRLYTAEDAKVAIGHAETIAQFCKNILG